MVRSGGRCREQSGGQFCEYEIILSVLLSFFYKGEEIIRNNWEGQSEKRSLLLRHRVGTRHRGVQSPRTNRIKAGGPVACGTLRSPLSRSWCPETPGPAAARSALRCTPGHLVTSCPACLDPVGARVQRDIEAPGSRFSPGWRLRPDRPPGGARGTLGIIFPLRRQSDGGTWGRDSGVRG